MTGFVKNSSGSDGSLPFSFSAFQPLSIYRAVPKSQLFPTPLATTATAGNMSAGDKTKLDGIAPGAEVNVNADWDAISGDAQVLNKPATYPPSAHTHPTSATIGLDAALAAGLLDATTKANAAQAAAIATASTDATTKSAAAQAAAIAAAATDATTKADAAQAAAIAAAANFSVGDAIHAAAVKAAPADDDQFGLIDSAAASALKQFTWSALKAALKTYFDTLYATLASVALKAPLANPALTGIPTAPTAADGTNTTQLATCAFVLANAGDAAPLPDALTEYVDAISPANRRALIGAGTSNEPPTLVLDAPPTDGTTGVLQVETLLITAGATTTETLGLEIVSHNGTVISGYDIDVTAADSTPALVAAKIRAAYSSDTVLGAIWQMGGTGAAITYTRQAPAAANDTALLLRLHRGITTLDSSTNTTAGVAESGTPASGLGQKAVYDGRIYFCTRLTPVKWVCPVLA